mgnify:CR=1 FL=1
MRIQPLHLCTGITLITSEKEITMKAFWKGIASVLFYAIGAALLVYAAARSLMFIQSTLPADQQIIGFLALAATSGGMIAWLLVFLHKAEGLAQKITAALMVALDALGEFTLFTFDTLLESGKSGMTATLTPDEIRGVILGMSALIAVNILATVAFHIFDPENIRAMRESFVRDRLESEALKLIEKRGDEIARELAPALAEQWAKDFESRFSDLRALGLGKLAKDKNKPQDDEESQDDESAGNWGAWLEGWRAARRNGKQESLPLHSEAQSRLPEFREGETGASPAPFQSAARD